MKKKFLSVVMLFSSFGVISTLTSCNHIIELNSKAEIKLTLEDVENKTLEVGETLTLNLKVENTNKKATFVSSNEEVLTVNENGVVEAKGVGSAKIYALIQDEKEIKSNSLEFNVVAKSDIKVALDVISPMLIVNDTFDLKPTITGNINNYPVSYISSDTTVATIDNNGKITALKEGKTKISVVIKDIERASIEFNIFNSYVPCENISLKEKQIFLSINEEYEVNPTYSPMNSIKGFTLTSEDNELVKVEGNKIIGLKETYSPVKVTITSGNATFDLLVTVVNGENAKIIEEVKAKLDTSLSLEPTLAKDGNLTISKLNEQNEETSKKVYDFEVYNDNKTSTIYTNNGFVNRYTAAILIILLYFKNNFQTADEHQNYNSIVKEFSDIEDFYNLLNEAIAFYNIRNYVDAIRHLNYISNMYPVQLLVVRDILKSISLTKLLDNDYRNDAITCLEGYTFENIKEEGELYLQILLARISSFSHNGDIKQAQKCERQIYQYLQDRLSYDEDAKTTLHILKRKSNCMHECLISERYIKESVEYFKPLPGHTAALNPVQYLMSLANHSGILIECGRFSESILEINNAYTFIKINPMLEFPRLQIVDNNFLIAVYLNNYNMKNEILNSYKKLVDISENADNIFINSNYSALLAVNGKTEEAYTLLQKTKRQLSNNRENFYEISIENNLLILELFNKRYSNAQLLLDQLLKAIHGVIDESYYRKKYELLQMAINQQIEIPLDKIDTFLFDYCPHYQEAWDYWGHSFDFTALYYWSDL